MLEVTETEIRIHADSPQADPAILLVRNHPRIQVQVNGSPASGRVSVAATDHIEVLFHDATPKRGAQIDIVDDGLHAVLNVKYESGLVSRLVPQSPSPLVNLAVKDEQMLPAPFSVKDIEQLLAEQRVIINVDFAAITRFIGSGESGSCVCAAGQAAVEGEPEQYKLLIAESNDLKLVGITPIRPVLTVRTNTPLAQHIARKEGVPGVTVRGQVVPPKPLPKRVPRLGRGVEENETGLVHSTRSGRVIQTPTLLDVTETFEHQGAYRMLDGHINFDGDVVIRGDVEEGVEIVAGGKVFVYGAVSQAHIVADGGIVVNNGVFASTLRAGTRAVAHGSLHELVNRIRQELLNFVEGVREVTAALTQRGLAVDVTRISARVLEDDKFQHALKWSEDISKWREEHSDSIGAEWNLFAEHLAEDLMPTKLTSVRNMAYWERFAESLTDRIEHLPPAGEADVDVQMKYAQNANIESTGSIISTGQGFYQCQLQADRTVKALGNPGVILGCVVTAGSLVEAREIGSQAGSHTAIEIKEKEGSVKAKVIYADTSLSLGPWRKKVVVNMNDATWP